MLAITKNYNPYLLALAAIFAIVLGIFTKFGAIIATIPAPVIGGASLILYGMIAANGLKTMVEAKIDFSDSKNMIICSLILVIGIGLKVTGHTLDIGVVSFSPLAVATFVGIIVNALFLSRIKTAFRPFGHVRRRAGGRRRDARPRPTRTNLLSAPIRRRNSDETSETAARHGDGKRRGQAGRITGRKRHGNIRKRACARSSAHPPQGGDPGATCPPEPSSSAS